MREPEDILWYWFGDHPTDPLKNSEKWWKKDPEFDQEIRELFEEDLEDAHQGGLDSWKETSQGSLAFIILLDQFSRNIYRGTPKAFAQDPLALAACLKGLALGFDQELNPVERWFYCMPLVHTEDLEKQKLSVRKFRELADQAPPSLKDALESAYDYSVKHHDIIKRFGRFPHRNGVLGRPSTPEETEFLKGPNSSF